MKIENVETGRLYVTRANVSLYTPHSTSMPFDVLRSGDVILVVDVLVAGYAFVVLSRFGVGRVFDLERLNLVA